MNNKDFTMSFLVEQSPREVFEAVNNVQGWWIDQIEGESHKLNDEFSVQFADIHYSRQKLVEFVPDSKVVWLITDSRLSFLTDKEEWTGSKIVFEISKQDSKTKFQFTHEGLVPDIECYSSCSNAWSDFITKSLFKLITTGAGEPFHK